jgi:hypothetical protein
MNKEWFSHDYNTRVDYKIKKLIIKHNYQGYGLFWAIVEELYKNANALPLDYECIAIDLRADCELVTSVINDFGLFKIEDGIISSESAQRRLDERNSKSIKARESANLRWGNANALPKQSKGNAIKGKEIKGKEKKEKDIIICDAGASENYKSFFDWAYTQKNAMRVMSMEKPITAEEYDRLYEDIGVKEIFKQVQAMENYKELHKKCVSANLTIRNWHKRNNP